MGIRRSMMRVFVAALLIAQVAFVIGIADETGVAQLDSTEFAPQGVDQQVVKSVEAQLTPTAASAAAPKAKLKKAVKKIAKLKKSVKKVTKKMKKAAKKVKKAAKKAKKAAKKAKKGK